MKAAVRLLAVYIGFCLMALAVAVPASFADALSSLERSGGSPVLGGSLEVPGGQFLLGSEGARDAEEARHANPEAAFARQESQTKYDGLGAQAASRLAGEMFPGVVHHPTVPLSQLPEGQHVTNIIDENSAQVSLAQGGHAVLESMEPIATKSSPGKWAPINLSVEEVEGAFRVAHPAVGISIPKRLQQGVSLASSGVSLTPVDASGTAAGGEGHVDGSVVFYGGVDLGSDLDIVVKPEAGGFSEDAVLRAASSPGQLFYRVGLPKGASLVEAKDGSKAVDIVDGGTVVATVSAPAAEDAAGTMVPVSMNIDGSLLVLNVNKKAGTYQYPILVDPVVDTYLTKETGYGSGKTTNWHFSKSNETRKFQGTENKSEWVLSAESHHGEHEWGALEYTTQGESKIQLFELNGKGSFTSLGHVEDLMEMVSSKSEAETTPISLPEIFGTETERVEGSAGNTAEVLMTATGEGKGYGPSLSITSASVEITQSKGPEASIDNSHEYVDGGKRNIFFGSGNWIGPNSGAFEFHSHDPGIGIGKYNVEVVNGTSSWKEGHIRVEEGECSGFECAPPELSKGYSYNSAMPNGEDTLTVKVEDLDGGGSATTTQTLKVDNEPPHGITFSGLPSNHEIAEGQHIVLKASATDGIEGTPSSGLASILLEVDGQSISGPQGGCPKGPALAAQNGH